MQILIDKREKQPWSFAGLGVELTHVTLETGDYQLAGDYLAVVERKSIADLAQTIGGHRDRFLRECCRMSQFRYRAIVIEGTTADVHRRGYVARVTPGEIFRVLGRIQRVHGIQVLWAVNHKAAARLTYEFFCWAEVAGPH